MSGVAIMFVAGLAVGYFAGWAQYRRKPYRQRVFLTYRPEEYPVGSVAHGWRVLRVDKVDLEDWATFWRITAELAE